MIKNVFINGKAGQITLSCLIIFISVFNLMATDNSTNNQSSVFKTQMEKVSYCIGLDIGQNLKSQNIDVKMDNLMQGLKDSITGTKALLSDKEIKEVMEAFQKEMAAKQEMQLKDLAIKNKKEGEEFLTKNKKNKDVKTLPSGLQYKIITQGKGKTPKATDTVEVNYRGTLINGTEFDSSYKRNKSVEFVVNEVIQGWAEALQIMPIGSKWEVCVPSDLAYGEQGAGALIGPNSTLCFTIELLSIKDKSSINQSKDQEPGK